MSNLPVLDDFYQSSFSLEHTTRYSMKPVIRPETVASHSFFVALGVMLLAREYEFSVGRAVKIALCHDLAEMQISDVNHVVKRTYPDLAKVLKEVERDVVDNFPDEVRHYCIAENDGSVEALVVKFADAWQCHQYAAGEIALGNRGYMQEVFDRSAERMNDMRETLEPWRKK